MISPMLYGFDCYGNEVEQSAPQAGQGFLDDDRNIVYFVAWDRETGLARCLAQYGETFFYSKDSLRWLPACNIDLKTLFAKADY